MWGTGGHVSVSCIIQLFNELGPLILCNLAASILLMRNSCCVIFFGDNMHSSSYSTE